MYKKVSIDFETRSTCDLIKAGSDVYSEDPITEPLCLAYAFDDEPVHIWIKGEDDPAELLAFVRSGGEVWGWNIGGFEMPIWNNICHLFMGWPELKIKQCVDPMAMAYAMGFPGALAHAAPALGLDIVKDMKGSRIMLQLCKPRKLKTGDVWYEPETHPEKFEALYSYCKQDVEVERAVGKKLLRLSERESKLWLIDWEINRTGVKVDTKSAVKALEIVEYNKKVLDEKMRDTTSGAVSMCTAVGQLSDWLNLQGVETPGVAKADILDLLEKEDLPEVCRKALVLRQEAAKTSTAKLNAMLRGAAINGRMKGMFHFHGASTGRWAGRRVQLQNLPRPNLEQSDIEKVFKILNSGKPVKVLFSEISKYGSPLQVISDCLRGFLCAEKGNELIACDFSAIEARVLAWLAGEEKVLEIFRGHGKIYEAAAVDIYKIKIEDVTKAQRQIGKVAALALGYQGGKGAFQQMAKGYNVKITDDEADAIKNAWRESHPKIVRYWSALENAALRAMHNPGTKTQVGPINREVMFLVSGSFLWCKLPSGRTLCYPYPKVEEFETPWGASKLGITYKGMDTYTRKWSKIKTYGGKLCENVTQAVARDLLSEALIRFKEYDLKTVMHVHDEIVIEAPKGTYQVKEIEMLMAFLPEWAQGMPVEAGGWRGPRFRK